jgi:hypothetical protein
MKAKHALAVLAAVVLSACAREAPPPPAAPAEGAAGIDLKAGPLPPTVTITEERTTPAPAAKPAPAPAPATAPVPAPTPAHAPTLATTHGKVGDAKCRMCHRLQHDSWSASPHAAKGLDCEGCHGGGADFTKVMRDRTAAIAAGLVLPKQEFCRRCHKADWQDGMYLRVHAHKVK